MEPTQYLAKILEELQVSVTTISDQNASKLVERIAAANKVFVSGAGRSGLMGKAFAMRMMHMGIDAYVVGETVTANLEKGDLLIIGSGSGETKSLIPIVEKAKNLGGDVAVVTLSSESTLAKLADLTIILPGSPKDYSGNSSKTIQPMGSLFEQTLLLFYDSLILSYMEIQQLDSQTMYGKHANLE